MSLWNMYMFIVYYYKCQKLKLLLTFLFNSLGLVLVRNNFPT